MKKEHLPQQSSREKANSNRHMAVLFFLMRWGYESFCQAKVLRALQEHKITRVGAIRILRWMYELLPQPIKT